MPTIYTLGNANRRALFTYEGSVDQGVVLQHVGRPRVSADFFNAILDRFSGQTIPGGFSMTNPTPGGLGEWVMNNSHIINPVMLTPRHASFIAAILVHENHITSSLNGNAVYLHFH